jgi:tyrosine-protein kinase Etk/Wzc
MAIETKTIEERSVAARTTAETAGDLSPYDAEEVDLLDLLLPLLQNRRTVLKWIVSTAIITAIVVFLLPNQYEAATKIMPPQQAQSTATAMLGQLGALAGLAGKDIGLKNPSDLYVGIIKSRSIADAIIQQFDLQHYFHKKHLADTRKYLESHSEVEAGKDGLISIKYEDKDPKRAADIANAYVAQLYAVNRRLAISEASQRRLFFEKELEAEKNHLADAEVDLKQTQESTGLIELSGQADAIIRSVAQLQSQLSGKQVQLEAMKSFATSENPDVIRTEQEIAALKTQLANVELTNKLGKGNIAIPTGKIPQAGLEYIRKLREVKYHEGLFEILAKQFEAAKIDEGKNAPVIQVVDTAVVPEVKAGPHRGLIILGGAILGLIIGCFHVWISSAYSRMKQNPETSSKLSLLHQTFNGRS